MLFMVFGIVAWSSYFILCAAYPLANTVPNGSFVDSQLEQSAQKIGIGSPPTSPLGRTSTTTGLSAGIAALLPPAIDRVGDSYQFNVPGTDLRVRFEPIAGGAWFNSNFIAQLFMNVKKELKKEPSAVVINPAVFAADYENVHLQVERSKGEDEYPNLTYGDARKVLGCLLGVIRQIRLFRELSAQLVWTSGEYIGDIVLSSAVSKPQSTPEHPLVQNNSNISILKGRQTLTFSPLDYFFKVPDTQLSVTLFPEGTFMDLDRTMVSSCLKAMQAILSLSDSSQAITKTSEKIKDVQLSLEALPLLADNSSNAYRLTCGDAIQVLGAFAGYIKDMDLYVSLSYQIYRLTEFVAIGTLHPTKQQLIVNTTFLGSLNSMESVEMRSLREQ